MAQGEPIRVLIAEQTKSLRAAIRRRLKEAGDIEVVAEVPDLKRLLEHAFAHPVDVVLLNDYLPPMSNAHAGVTVRKEGVQASILSFAATLEPELIQHSIRRGVNGFLHRDEIDDLVVEAVRRVCKGERYFSPRVRNVYFKE